MNLAWSKISEKGICCGYRKILRRIYRLPNQKTHVFDILDEGLTVSILPITKSGRVILARQYRPGPEQIVDDLPCGMVNKGETPLHAAQRELLEETGYTGEMIKIGTCLESAYSNKIRHNFVARNCRKVETPHLDETKFIEVRLVTVRRLRSLLRRGKLTVVETGYMGLDALGLL